MRYQMSNVDEQIDFILDLLWMVAYSQRLRHGNKDENVGVASGKIKSLLAQVEKEARIDQMYIEAEAHRLGGGRGLPRTLPAKNG